MLTQQRESVCVSQTVTGAVFEVFFFHLHTHTHVHTYVELGADMGVLQYTQVSLRGQFVAGDGSFEFVAVVPECKSNEVVATLAPSCNYDEQYQDYRGLCLPLKDCSPGEYVSAQPTHSTNRSVSSTQGSRVGSNRPHGTHRHTQTDTDRHRHRHRHRHTDTQTHTHTDTHT